MNKEYHQYTTSIPPVYHQYTISMTPVYHQFTTSIPWYTFSIPWYTVSIPWYTASIPPVYHKGLYRFGSGILFSHGGAMKLFFPISASRLLCFALHWIALHCIVQSEAHFNLKLTALRSMRVQWICFFLCSVWNAFQLKPDSTEIYENYVFVFQLVMHFSLSLRCALHSEKQEKEAQDEIKYI